MAVECARCSPTALLLIPAWMVEYLGPGHLCGAQPECVGGMDKRRTGHLAGAACRDASCSHSGRTVRGGFAHCRALQPGSAHVCMAGCLADGGHLGVGVLVENSEAAA